MQSSCPGVTLFGKVWTFPPSVVMALYGAQIFSLFDCVSKLVI